MKARVLLPLIIFSFVVILLWRGLSLDPNHLPSPLINRATPAFQLNTLFDPKKTTTQQDLLGHVTLLNIWATWCGSCADEHELLVDIAKDKTLFLYGINYKDNPVTAKDWLKKQGNPYQIVATDPNGNAAIDLGVYVTPETFIIDKKGFIRYTQIGSITPDIWENTLKPIVKKLQGET